jgi:hypothetical protein
MIYISRKFVDGIYHMYDAYYACINETSDIYCYVTCEDYTCIHKEMSNPVPILADQVRKNDRIRGS